MSITICTLSSGSSGNCIFVSSGNTHLLIDAGISMKATEKHLQTLGRSLCDINAVFVTHEHSDHIKGLEMISKHHHIPIYAPSGCIAHLPASIESELIRQTSNQGCKITVGDIEIISFPTPHDSAASVGYTFEIEGRKFGIATDMGIPTKNVAEALLGCESVIIEANYEKKMLESSGIALNCDSDYRFK